MTSPPHSSFLLLGDTPEIQQKELLNKVGAALNHEPVFLYLT